MAYPTAYWLCSTGGLRLVLVLVGMCLVGYTIRPPLYWHLKENGSCPPCRCDCSKDLDPIPLDIINTSSFSDCGEHEPEVKEEMEKDIIALLSEELSLQQTVANETLQRSDALLMGATRVSSHYQKEAEKCNAGMETCEEARERAEAELAAELRLSEVWERRAREVGWEDTRIYS